MAVVQLQVQQKLLLYVTATLRYPADQGQQGKGKAKILHSPGI
jgi:hypothetical protein